MEEKFKITKQDKINCGLVFLISMVVYLITLAPTVTSEDSGELITAAYTFGVPHPPGFPLYCLIGKLFTYIPIGSIAWRLNFMSAFFGSGTVAVFYLIIRVFGGLRWGAVIGSLVLAFSWTFWNQAVIAEVYTLNAFLFALILFCIFYREHAGSNKALLIAAVFWGLALCNHYMLTLLITPPVVMYVLIKYYKDLKWRTLASAVVLGAIPLVLYAYLPLASWTNPALDWGNTGASVDNFVNHVKRDAYKSLELTQDVTPSTKIFFIFQFLYLLWNQFTPFILIPFFILGWTKLSRFMKEKWMVMAVICFNVPVLLWILKFSSDRINLTRVEEYYLPAYMCIAFFITMGICKFIEVYKWKMSHEMMIGILVVIPFVPLIGNWKANDFSDYYLAYDYNKTILESLEPNAIYFPSADFDSFPCLYLQAVEGVRPDVLLGDVSGDVVPEVKEIVRKLAPESAYGNKGVLQKILIEKCDRPVYFTGMNEIINHSSYEILRWGLVYRAMAKGRKIKAVAPEIFSDKPLRNIDLPTAKDHLGQSLYAVYHQKWGEYLAKKGQKDEALKKYEIAIEHSKYHKEGLNNLGSSLAEHGFIDKGVETWRRSADLHPGYLISRRNLAKHLEVNGKLKDAANVYRELEFTEKDNQSLKRKIAKVEEIIARPKPEKKQRTPQEMMAMVKNLLKKDPKNPVLYNNLGSAYAQMGDGRMAVVSYKRALALKPDYEMARKNLANAYQRLVGKK